MSRLPSLRPRRVVTTLERAGFVVVRIVGSHYQLFNERTRRHTTVPYHNRDLPRGTVSAIIRQAGLTREEFLNLLR
ncbi:MAG: type II toxin-antitoxin system HicA family toxin [Xanthobacteraceae bacterium]